MVYDHRHSLIGKVWGVEDSGSEYGYNAGDKTAGV